MRTGAQLCGLWVIRIILNILVLATLGGAAYLIYYVTEISSEVSKLKLIASSGWTSYNLTVSVHVTDDKHLA